MKIETARFEYNELQLIDLSKIEKIARDMAWNDTINVLLDYDKDILQYCPDKKELFQYQELIKQNAKSLEKNGIDRQDFYSYMPQHIIPESLWHINFSMLKPNFRQSALKFINMASQKRKETDRLGFWFSIKDKSSGQLIGATMLSTRLIEAEGINRIGHSGQFIHPKFQKKGIVSETKAVMVDFMYKYLIDKQEKILPNNTRFFTTCDILNKGSQALQRKSGATCINSNTNLDHNKLLFYATRDEIMNSRLLLDRNIYWKAEFDNGKTFSSTTGNTGLSPFTKENTCFL